eukprot:TRINITY_DN29580_c0_g1_i2.p1 TRINITY_DN29580_c0_g1~~TRINITY_DN29580_c0_g1_i2.p1  ORF type:complete len:126 (-),score=16.43 TRINITY_DN29580_c0_g1_i2:102-479(-)
MCIRDSSDSLCQPCFATAVDGLKIFLMILGVLVYVAYQIRSYLKYHADLKNEAILLKIIINYSSQILLISVVDLGWTVDFKMLLHNLSFLFTITGEFASVDCMISGVSSNIYGTKLAFYLLSPVI